MMKKLLYSLIGFLIITPVMIWGIFTGFDIEKKLVYEPSQEFKSFSNELENKTDLKFFKNNDGLKITYWHIKGNKKRPKILYCHGNADNASFFIDKIEFLAKQGYEIFLLDYRGYGQSEGSPDEAGLYADTVAMVKHLEKKYSISPKNLVIWGHSLGGGVVSGVAEKMQFLGVILEGTFTKIEDMKPYAAVRNTPNKAIADTKKFIYNLIPVTQKFENDKKIANINSPILIMHAKNDDYVPALMGKNLHKLNPKSKLFLSPKGGHDDYGWQNKVVLEFINKLK